MNSRWADTPSPLLPPPTHQAVQLNELLVITLAPASMNSRWADTTSSGRWMLARLPAGRAVEQPTHGEHCGLLTAMAWPASGTATHVASLPWILVVWPSREATSLLPARKSSSYLRPGTSSSTPLDLSRCPMPPSNNNTGLGMELQGEGRDALSGSGEAVGGSTARPT